MVTLLPRPAKINELHLHNQCTGHSQPTNRHQKSTWCSRKNFPPQQTSACMAIEDRDEDIDNGEGRITWWGLNPSYPHSVTGELLGKRSTC